jgi:hypothetical protein
LRHGSKTKRFKVVPGIDQSELARTVPEAALALGTSRKNVNPVTPSISRRTDQILVRAMLAGHIAVYAHLTVAKRYAT